MFGIPLSTSSTFGPDGSKTRRHTLRIRSSLFPQMASSQIDKHILEAGLSRREVQKLRAVFSDCIEQRGDGQVRLTHGEADQTIVMTHRFHTGQRPPSLQGRSVAGGAAGCELHHVMSAEAFDQLRRRAFCNDLAMINDGQAIAKALAWPSLIMA